MNKEDIQLIIDILMYLDILDNWNNEIYIGNDIGSSINLLRELQIKHKGIENAKKRRKIIGNLITKLEELLK